MRKIPSTVFWFGFFSFKQLLLRLRRYHADIHRAGKKPQVREAFRLMKRGDALLITGVTSPRRLPQHGAAIPGGLALRRRLHAHQSNTTGGHGISPPPHTHTPIRLMWDMRGGGIFLLFCYARVLQSAQMCPPPPTTACGHIYALFSAQIIRGANEGAGGIFSGVFGAARRACPRPCSSFHGQICQLHASMNGDDARLVQT